MHSITLIIIAALFSAGSMFILFRWQFPTLARYMTNHPHPVVITLDLGFTVSLILPAIAPLVLLIGGEAGRGAWLGLMTGALFFLCATLIFGAWALIIRNHEDLSRPRSFG